MRRREARINDLLLGLVRFARDVYVENLNTLLNDEVFTAYIKQTCSSKSLTDSEIRYFPDEPEQKEPLSNKPTDYYVELNFLLELQVFSIFPFYYIIKKEFGEKYAASFIKTFLSCYYKNHWTEDGFKSLEEFFVNRTNNYYHILDAYEGEKGLIVLGDEAGRLICGSHLQGNEKEESTAINTSFSRIFNAVYESLEGISKRIDK